MQYILYKIGYSGCIVALSASDAAEVEHFQTFAHDTIAQSLFSRALRHFSANCGPRLDVILLFIFIFKASPFYTHDTFCIINYVSCARSDFITLIKSLQSYKFIEIRSVCFSLNGFFLYRKLRFIIIY
jgi:hypothetical protein